MRTLPNVAFALALPLVLAGCANVSPVDDAAAARAGLHCDVGEVVIGFNASGGPECEPAPFRDSSCPSGQFVNGFQDGHLTCATPNSAVLQERAQSTGKEATQEVSSNLKVLNVYGLRNSSATPGLWDLQINTELSAGALPMDLSKLIIRYSDGSYTYNYAHAPAALPNAAATSTHFNATWIRGTGGSTFVMQPGDLVQIHFNVQNAHDISARTSIAVSLIPESGSPISADFKTPATYGTDTTLTLR